MTLSSLLEIQKMWFCLPLEVLGNKRNNFLLNEKHSQRTGVSVLYELFSSFIGSHLYIFKNTSTTAALSHFFPLGVRTWSK